ncbi:MAG: hypothetical protein FJ100_08525 [Deltaproteobacteria bacterium]|nr:hypothetical protein [Deltaproteobacteria bacterium]
MVGELLALGARHCLRKDLAEVFFAPANEVEGGGPVRTHEVVEHGLCAVTCRALMWLRNS